MADRYWISNADDDASVAANWASNADGSGTNAVPTTGDNVYFGHADTLAADFGNGACTWDITPTIASLTTYSDYNEVSITSDTISFTAGSTITHNEADWDSIGYRVGMVIVITGAINAANNGTFNITALSGGTMTVSQTSLVVEAEGASISITYDTYISVEANFGMAHLHLDSHIKNDSGSASTITFSGTFIDAENRYITNGSKAQVSNGDDLTYSIDSSANGAAALYFDSGPHGAVSLTSTTKVCFGFREATSNEFANSEFYSFVAGASVTVVVDNTSTPLQNQSKVFSLLTSSTFSWSPSTFDAGLSTWKFKLDSSTFAFPVSDGTKTYRWYNVILTTDTAGRKATIGAGRTLSANSLVVEADTLLEGHKTRGEASSTVISVRRPKILGAWNFSQLSDGIYVSLMETAFPITPADGAADRIQISDGSGKFTSSADLTWDEGASEFTVDGKLTVTGLIDPTGMVFTPQATNPETTNPLNTIWIDSETGHLIRGDRDTESTVHFNVRNDEGTTIPLGAPLYSKGEIGGSQRIKVGIADSSDPAKMPAIGLAMEEMNTTSTKDGNMIITGILNENITITGVVEQDTIYVAPHGGTAPYLTTTRPTSGSHLVQNVGVCVKQASANTSQGMKVSAIGRTNDIPNGVITTNSGDADYVYIDHGNTFKKITPSDLGIGGGGGSGTVTSVAVSGSDGIQIDSGSPITTSGTIALGVDATALRTHINVEDGADVTDTANVTAAGALMDSEVTNLADVKAFDPADYATAAQGSLADTALQAETDPVFTASPAASITNAGSGAVITSAERTTLGSALQAETDPIFTASEANLFVAGDASKLAGIATGATAYTDANAIAAVEGEATLDLTGNVGLADGKYIKWGTDSYIQSNASGVDLTILATDDMFLMATDAIGLRNNGTYTMWLTATNRVGVGTTTPAEKLDVVGNIGVSGTVDGRDVAADGTKLDGIPTGQYQRFVLQDAIGSPVAISAGTTTQLTFGPAGAVLVAQYTPPTDWIVDPINSDHIVINVDGLYQFTFCGFLAGISGSNPDYRITISSTSSLTGDILSFRNRTSTVDRHTGSGVATVYLTAASTVYFSVRCDGRTYQVGGQIATPAPGETRTFLDVRRLE